MDLTTHRGRRVCPMTCMAADIQQRILTGELPPHMTPPRLSKSTMPLAWADRIACPAVVATRMRRFFGVVLF